ncbi:MAG: aminotransferase class V-fold PLP-dependent enzyme [Planctomycetaceae bacterium]
MTGDRVAARIYLDNAATSFPKPGAVYDAVDRFNREVGAAVGRSAYQSAVDVQRGVDHCRSQAAQLLGAPDSNRIVFTFNGTDSLNLAIHGLLQPGDHVVTTVVEHNSVLRPLRALQETRNVELTHVDCDKTGRIEPADIRNAIRPNTKLIAVIHASNVTGTIQPVVEIGEIALQAGVRFLVDAAQSAGHLPIDVSKFPVDLLACPGHKGLLGPLGTGLLYVARGCEAELNSVRQGGTGSHSEDDRQPESLPDKYESGNHNTPGLIGLEAALTWLLDRGVDAGREHERELTGRLVEGLSSVPDLRIFGPPNPQQRVGVVSVSHPDFEPQVLAAVLDEHFAVQTRAGLHCAPKIHERLGTLNSGGTVRFSVGPFTATNDIDTAIAAVRESTSA